MRQGRAANRYCARLPLASVEVEAQAPGNRSFLYAMPENACWRGNDVGSLTSNLEELLSSLFSSKSGLSTNYRQWFAQAS